MNFLKRIWNYGWAYIFDTPSDLVIAMRELENAKRDLLAAHSAVEYAKYVADAAVQYNQTRITRLSKYINTLTKEQEK